METEKSNIDKQYNVAKERLWSSNLSIRIASFYKFRQLAEKCPDDFKKVIFETLCDYLRNMPYDKYHHVMKKGKIPTKEYQTLLDVLFKSSGISIFGKFKADLHKACLMRTYLEDACFKNANLSDANFFRADLSNANLSGANLSGARLWDANLWEVNFSDAILQRAQLKEANLMEVHSIERADFRGAKIGNRSIKKEDLPPLYEKGEYYAEWNPPKKEED